MLRKSNISEVAKATIWFFIASIIAKCVSMLTMPIFARIMTTEQMGQFTTYTTWLEILTIITTFRLDYGIFNKGMSKYSDDKDGYTSSMLGVTTTLTLFFLICYLCFHNFFNQITELNTPITIAIFVELFFTPAISFWMLKQRYQYKYKSTVFFSLSMTICNAIISILSVLNSEDKGTSRILSCILVNTCFGLVIYIVCLTKNHILFNKEYIKFALTFNAPLLPHYFSSFILEQSDKIMIQKMIGKAEMGIYGVACSLAYVIRIITSSLSNAILPWQYQSLKAGKYEDIRIRFKGICIIAMSCILMFICVAPEALVILASEKYMEALYVIPPLSASVIFTFIYGIIGNIEFFYDKNKFSMYVSCCSAALNLVLNYIFIAKFGYVAAAYSTLICYALSSIAHIVYTNCVSINMSHQKIIDEKFMFIAIILIIATVIIMSILYKYYIIRYILLLLILVIMVINRQKIIKILRRTI